MAPTWNTSWIWHPDWVENAHSVSPGAFVHFRKSFDLERVPQSHVNIAITADTRYKLYINSRMVHAGPVKGDQQAWFYDVLDIQPHLRIGKNNIAVHVLRFYYNSYLATSFPRTSHAGLYIRSELTNGNQDQHLVDIQTDDTWETALDPCRKLVTESKVDYFLHNFEEVDLRDSYQLRWVPAKPYKFMVSHGLASPWNLFPRMIPLPRLKRTNLRAVHNMNSKQTREAWELLLNPNHQHRSGILLAKGTSHHVEFEVEYHTTAYVTFHFSGPSTGGSKMTVTWSEGYENEPIKLPFERRKGDRADTSKSIVGPKDHYTFGGSQASNTVLGYHNSEQDDEVYTPFHFRTFRYFAVDIEVAADSDLVLNGIDIVKTNYPLQVLATFPRVETYDGDAAWVQKLWQVSLRTLENCMHDCYEDCPFFEQLQYAMDTKSSALFTYMVSRDDRLARQAMVQLRNSFQPAIGLTASCAPSHHLQIISHFSLFWVCMIVDHYEHFGDESFTVQFLPVIEAVLDSFHGRRDPETGLIRTSQYAGDWAFVDWSEAYQPMGTPPAAEATGFMTFTNQLYAYTLERLSSLELCLKKASRADDHKRRADSIVQAIQINCFDGTYFTDGLARLAQANHYSEHSQIWAVLCGARTGQEATELLHRSLAISSTHSVWKQGRELTKVSIAMAMYSLRALSAAGDEAYERHFHEFWEPWQKQLDLNLTTWVEDYITQRSDCHAWGSLPLYEFPAEVVGFKWTMSGGERVLTFKPRLRLFKTFEARIPVSGSVGNPVIAHVCWQDVDNSRTDLHLSWEGDQDVEDRAVLTVHVDLPNEQHEIIDVFDDKEWQIFHSR